MLACAVWAAPHCCDSCNPNHDAVYQWDRWTFVIEGEQLGFKRCPKHAITGLSSTLLHLYAHYRNGFLPFAGGLLDQPAIFYAGMEIIQNTYNLIEAEQNTES